MKLIILCYYFENLYIFENIYFEFRKKIVKEFIRVRVSFIWFVLYNFDVCSFLVRIK